MKSRAKIKQALMIPTLFILLSAGFILLLVGLSYFIYSWKAHSDLDLMMVTFTDNPLMDDHSLITKREVVDSAHKSDDDYIQINDDNYSDIVQAELIYPGEILNPALWRNPFLSDIRSPEVADLMKGFTPWSNDLLNESQIPGIPIKLTINAINLDSGIVPLKIVDVEDSRSYETPKDIVGYIPETANPGKSGSMWLFGHLESPIRGEGSIFSRLPEIPDILRHGVPVHALVETTDASYLYWITETLTFHQVDLRIMDIEEASLVMVTCIPRLVYDYRLLVMGELIGVKNQDIE